MQRSQEAGGRAPGTPSTAGRGLQPGPGGRGGGGGCSSSRPLPHPGRPGAAELQVRRDPSPRGDGSGAGAVVRAVAAVPAERAVVGPGLRLPAWVWVGACVGASVSVTAAASPTKSRNGEAAGQARRAAILETGKGRGSQRWPLRGGAGRKVPPTLCQHLGGPPVCVFTAESVSSDPSSCPRDPTGFTNLTGRGGQPHPVAAARPGRRKETGPGRPGVKMAAQASRRQGRQSRGRRGGHAAQPCWCVGGARLSLHRPD